jgi:hypothetical protein
LVAPRHEPPPAFGVSVGQPDLGQKVDGPQRRQNARIDLVGLDVRIGDRLTCSGLATITRPTYGESTRTTAIALPVASMTTSSSLPRLWPSSPPVPRASC